LDAHCFSALLLCNNNNNMVLSFVRNDALPASFFLAPISSSSSYDPSIIAT
jgi:hypothetical protein